MTLQWRPTLDFLLDYVARRGAVNDELKDGGFLARLLGTIFVN